MRKTTNVATDVVQLAQQETADRKIAVRLQKEQDEQDKKEQLLGIAIQKRIEQQDADFARKLQQEDRHEISTTKKKEQGRTTTILSIAELRNQLKRYDIDTTYMIEKQEMLTAVHTAEMAAAAGLPHQQHHQYYTADCAVAQRLHNKRTTSSMSIGELRDKLDGYDIDTTYMIEKQEMLAALQIAELAATAPTGLHQYHTHYYNADRAIAQRLHKEEHQQQQQRRRRLQCTKVPTKTQVLAALAPCQLNAVNYVKDKAKKLHERALLELKKRVQHVGGGSHTQTELMQCLEYIRDEAPIIIHLQETTLRTLVNDTHYRNQFETKTSGGKRDYEVRQQWEREMFASCYDDVAGKMRVKYGCLNFCGDILGVKSVRTQYGPAYIVLKSHVRHRATFSLESKATRSTTIATNEYYAHVLHGYDDADLKLVLDVCKSARVGGRPSNCTEYKEVQIHGPICFATDIQALSVPGRQKDAGVVVSRNVELFRKMTSCNILWQEDLRNPDE